jgi:hypothetical protein
VVLSELAALADETSLNQGTPVAWPVSSNGAENRNKVPFRSRTGGTREHAGQLAPRSSSRDHESCASSRRLAKYRAITPPSVAMSSCGRTKDRPPTARIDVPEAESDWTRDQTR